MANRMWIGALLLAPAPTVFSWFIPETGSRLSWWLAVGGYAVGVLGFLFGALVVAMARCRWLRVQHLRECRKARVEGRKPPGPWL